MALDLSCEQVWSVLEKELFAVLGMTTAKGESRTVGIVYAVHDHKIYIVTGKDTWKARHVGGNPHVSITVPIAKRIPLMPWIKIPAATVTFCGIGSVHESQEVDKSILKALLRGLATDQEMLKTVCVIEIEPVGDFVTYGVGVSLMTMRHPEKSRGRTPVHDLNLTRAQI